MPDWPIPGPNGVRLIRTSATRLLPLLDECRATARRHGVDRLVYTLDEATTPADAEARLLASGRVFNSDTVALVLDSPPPPGPGFEVVDCFASFDDYADADRTAAAAFGQPAGEEDELVRRYSADRADPMQRLIGIRDGGRIAATGRLLLLPEGGELGGGCVHPEHRGRGLYRALVVARWQISAAAGRKGVATHARPDTSAPILLRLGFREVRGGRVRHLGDA